MDYEQENESQARRPLMMLMARAVYSLGGMAYVDLFIPLILSSSTSSVDARIKQMIYRILSLEVNRHFASAHRLHSSDK